MTDPDQVPNAGILFASGRFVMLSEDMCLYLRSEAERRGISMEEVYREDDAARAELQRITPPNAELLKLAERFPAPQEWYDE